MVSSYNKSLAITFLAVAIFISALSVDLVGAQNSTPGPHRRSGVDGGS